MSDFTEKLKAYLHDPVDKCFNIQTHILRAKSYAEKIRVTDVEEVSGPDHIASCMERSLLPKGIRQVFNEIKHPLSDGRIEISSIETDEVFITNEKVFKETGAEINSLDESKRFFYLWRNLLEKILDESKNKNWRRYIPLLPADTRIPDHSIWEHLKITSAVNAYLDKGALIQNNSLFLFTIGPVQSFISQARKTQDFYFGSFILSYLTFTGMKVIIDEYGPTSIIYPDLFRQPLMDWFLEKEKGISVKRSNSKFIDLPTIPNRFVAILPVSDAGKIKELAERAKGNITGELINIRKKILEKLKLKEQKIEELIEKQLLDFPQVYWVAIPWRKGDSDTEIDDLSDFFEESELERWKNLKNMANSKGEHPSNIGLLYQLLYTALEKSIGSRKNLREFKQFAEAGRKCSVCGERNVLFFRETENKRKFIGYNPDAIDLTGRISLKYLSDGEGLCGLCFIKRTCEVYLSERVDERVFKDLSFPSTAEIALADFKVRAVEKAKEDFEKYVELLQKENFPRVHPVPGLSEIMPKTIDGEWFFMENLRKEFIRKELGIELNDSDLKVITRVLEDLYEKTGKPNSYYALVYLDGDNMGKWLSGELLPSIEYAYNSETWENLPEDFKNELKNKLSRKPLTPAIHASISNALRNYSIEFVRKIVEEEHLGKLVYAGGDDLLAFVNLRDLIDVMEKLRFAFSGEIKIEEGNIKVDIQNQSGFVENDGVYILTMGKRATASMGVVLAHYKEPLKIVINKVFEMEKKAKSNFDKDSFSILLMKRSGEERVATFKWRYDGTLTTDVMRRVKDMMNDDNDRYISHRFIQKLKSEFIRLKKKNSYLSINEPIFNVELHRLIFRAYNCKIKDREDTKRKFVESFEKLLVDLFWRSGANIDDFTNFLEIASFLNKGE